VTFEAGSVLWEIEEFAFGKSGLKSIAIPTAVEVGGKNAFFYCIWLESVTFEASSVLEEIEEYAFAESGLKSIVIPASVGVIGQDAFRECRSLASVTFESSSALRAVGGSAFEDYPCSGRLEFPELLAAARRK
jgi:hypothetical protein